MAYVTISVDGFLLAVGLVSPSLHRQEVSGVSLFETRVSVSSRLTVFPIGGLSLIPPRPMASILSTSRAVQS